MKISIITATYNSEKNISYCLQSVVGQGCKNIEHIIIDGGSTDKTGEIIKASPSISLLVNGKPMIIQNNIKIRTHYGWCNVFQSKTSNAKEWVLKIE